MEKGPLTTPAGVVGGFFSSGLGGREIGLESKSSCRLMQLAISLKPQAPNPWPSSPTKVEHPPVAKNSSPSNATKTETETETETP